MFTGIVEQVGTVVCATQDGEGLNLRIAPETMWSDLMIGESVACSGVCLTVTDINEHSFGVQLSAETICKTAPRWQINSRLNLERALRLSDRLGGHLVSGHVDGVGEILSLSERGSDYTTLRVRAPERLARYLTPKGSICVDGVSLTLVDVGGRTGTQPSWAAHEFSLWLVPHTLKATTLNEWQVGSIVNLEADQIAKYTERLLRHA